MVDSNPICERYSGVRPQLDERRRRCLRQPRRGGRVWWDRGHARDRDRAQHDRSRAQGTGTGPTPPERVRRAGGGRKPLTEIDASCSTICWGWFRRASGATRVAAALDVQEPAPAGGGTAASWAPDQPHGRRRTAPARGYSLQANRKTREGEQPSRPRCAVRAHQRQRRQALAGQQPVISVDTKKKELVGDFKNAGREWRPRANPRRSACTTS